MSNGRVLSIWELGLTWVDLSTQIYIQNVFCLCLKHGPRVGLDCRSNAFLDHART
jgi:hypothetical protein